MVEEEKPSKAVGVLRILAGGFLGLIGMVIWMREAIENTAVGILFSLVMALSLRWVIVGFLSLVGKWIPRPKTYGAAILATFLFAALGPSVSRAYWASEEPRCWNKVKSSRDVLVWNKDYLKAVNKAARRGEFPSRYAEVQAEKAIKDKNFAELRFLWVQLHESQKELYDDASRTFVTKLFEQLFAEGVAKLQTSRGADPKLLAGFAALLADLKVNPTKAIVVDFKFDGKVGPLPQDAEMLARSRDKVPVLPLGEALATQAVERRKSQAIKDLGAAFNSVFPKDLLHLEGSANGVVDQHVHIAIEANCSRIPSFYVNGNEKNGKFTATDMLYKMKVTSKCQLIGLQGKKLAEFSIESEPAKSVSYRTRSTDPKWAPYSIILDSASDNFARLVMLKLGLPAPAPKSSYQFAL